MNSMTTSPAEKGQLVVGRISRMLPTTFAYCALVVLGVFFAAETGGYTLSTHLDAAALAIGAMTLVVWGQWFINDVYDKETDKHSNAHRATASGAITDRESLLIGWVLVGLGVAVTIPLGRYAVSALVVYIVVNTVYSMPPLRTKAGALSSMVTLGTMGAFSVLLGGAAIAGHFDRTVVTLAGAILFVMVLTMSYKDLKDAEHDAKSGVENFAVRYGAERVRRTLLILLPAVYVVLPLLFGMVSALPLFALFSITAFYLLFTWDGADAIVFQLDTLNGIFLIALGAVFYL